MRTLIRWLGIGLLALVLAAATALAYFGRDTRPESVVRLARSERANARAAERADSLVDLLSLDERVGLMTPLLGGLPHFLGDYVAQGARYNAAAYYAGGNARVGIPAIRFHDGPRGLVSGEATCFPVAVARAATWDPALERRVGEAIGAEIRAIGGNYFGGVCVNLLRHPAGGRAQEGYGEDPHLVGAMGAAVTRGVQHHNVMACAKHYAVNNQENVRFTVDVEAPERVLREVYLPHFRDCVDAGVASLMGAYNRFRGDQACESEHLLTTVLREDWGFEGFTISDFLEGVHDGPRAARAGLDVEMPAVEHYGADLVADVEAGRLDAAVVERSARRIARTVLDFETRPDPRADYPAALVGDPAHAALAREVAERSVTLLENRGGTLPLDADALDTVLVLGPRAAAEVIGDHGSSRVRPPYIVTPLEGLKAEYGDRVAFVYRDGADVAEAQALAKAADAVIVVAGYDHNDEGEFIAEGWGGDRASLRLHAPEVALIRAVGPLNPRTAVALVGGSAILTEAWRERVPAILMAFYPGMEGGTALARVLFGDVNPGGKLPFTVARDEAHYPDFDIAAEAVTYDRWHGYARLDRDGHRARYPFGHGLSYTTFRLDSLTAKLDSAAVRVAVTLANTGARAGSETVQVYVGVEGSDVERERKLLRAFRRVDLGAGETRRLGFAVPLDDLRYYDEVAGAWVLEPGVRYRVYVGGSSALAEDLVTDVRAVDDTPE